MNLDLQESKFHLLAVSELLAFVPARKIYVHSEGLHSMQHSFCILLYFASFVYWLQA